MNSTIDIGHATHDHIVDDTLFLQNNNDSRSRGIETWFNLANTPAPDVMTEEDEDYEEEEAERREILIRQIHDAKTQILRLERDVKRVVIRAVGDGDQLKFPLSYPDIARLLPNLRVLIMDEVFAACTTLLLDATKHPTCDRVVLYQSYHLQQEAWLQAYKPTMESYALPIEDDHGSDTHLILKHYTHAIDSLLVNLLQPLGAHFASISLYEVTLDMLLKSVDSAMDDFMWTDVRIVQYPKTVSMQLITALMPDLAEDGDQKRTITFKRCAPALDVQGEHGDDEEFELDLGLAKVRFTENCNTLNKNQWAVKLIQEWFPRDHIGQYLWDIERGRLGVRLQAWDEDADLRLPNDVDGAMAMHMKKLEERVMACEGELAYVPTVCEHRMLWGAFGMSPREVALKQHQRHTVSFYLTDVVDGAVPGAKGKIINHGTGTGKTHQALTLMMWAIFNGDVEYAVMTRPVSLQKQVIERLSQLTGLPLGRVKQLVRSKLTASQPRHAADDPREWVLSRIFVINDGVFRTNTAFSFDGSLLGQCIARSNEKGANYMYRLNPKAKLQVQNALLSSEEDATDASAGAGVGMEAAELAGEVNTNMDWQNEVQLETGESKGKRGTRKGKGPLAKARKRHTIPIARSYTWQVAKSLGAEWYDYKAGLERGDATELDQCIDTMNNVLIKLGQVHESSVQEDLAVNWSALELGHQPLANLSLARTKPICETLAVSDTPMRVSDDWTGYSIDLAGFNSFPTWSFPDTARIPSALQGLSMRSLARLVQYKYDYVLGIGSDGEELEDVGPAMEALHVSFIGQMLCTMFTPQLCIFCLNDSARRKQMPLIEAVLYGRPRLEDATMDDEKLAEAILIGIVRVVEVLMYLNGKIPTAPYFYCGALEEDWVSGHGAVIWQSLYKELPYLYSAPEREVEWLTQSKGEGQESELQQFLTEHHQRPFCSWVVRAIPCPSRHRSPWVRLTLVAHKPGAEVCTHVPDFIRTMKEPVFDSSTRSRWAQHERGSVLQKANIFPARACTTFPGLHHAFYAVKDNPIGVLNDVDVYRSVFDEDERGRYGDEGGGFMLVVDEVQRITSSTGAENKQYRGLRSMCAAAKYVVLMSATVMSNHARELLQLLSLVRPGYDAPVRNIASSNVFQWKRTAEKPLSYGLCKVISMHVRSREDDSFPKEVDHTLTVHMNDNQRRAHTLLDSAIFVVMHSAAQAYTLQPSHKYQKTHSAPPDMNLDGALSSKTKANAYMSRTRVLSNMHIKEEMLDQIEFEGGVHEASNDLQESIGDTEHPVLKMRMQAVLVAMGPSPALVFSVYKTSGCFLFLQSLRLLSLADGSPFVLRILEHDPTLNKQRVLETWGNGEAVGRIRDIANSCYTIPGRVREMETVLIDVSIITGSVSPKERESVLAWANSPHMLGHQRVLIISKAASEGLDLLGFRQAAKLEMGWNDTEWKQGKGRVVRAFGHHHLPENLRHIDSFQWVTLWGQPGNISSDEYLLRLTLRKGRQAWRMTGVIAGACSEIHNGTLESSYLVSDALPLGPGPDEDEDADEDEDKDMDA